MTFWVVCVLCIRLNKRRATARAIRCKESERAKFQNILVSIRLFTYQHHG
jgi:hypothetical protein